MPTLLICPKTLHYLQKFHGPESFLAEAQKVRLWLRPDSFFFIAIVAACCHVDADVHVHPKIRVNPVAQYEMHCQASSYIAASDIAKILETCL